MRQKDYLIQRGSRYCFRIKVPLHLQKAVGRIEIRRTLTATDPSLARMLAQRFAWVTMETFKAMDKRNELTPQQISNHLDKWYEKMMKRDLEVAKQIEAGLGEGTKAQYQDEVTSMGFIAHDLLEEIVDRGHEPDRPDFDQPVVPTSEQREKALAEAELLMNKMGETSDTVSAFGDTLPPLESLEEDQRRELLIAFLMKVVKVYSDKNHQQEEVTSGTTRETHQRPPETASEADTPNRTTRWSLIIAWEKYCTEKALSEEPWRGEIPDTARLAFDDMRELWGNPAVDLITREQCKEFRDLQSARPLWNLKQYKSWSARDILNRAEEIPDDHRRKGIRPKELLGRLISFTEWLVNEQAITSSPAAGLKVPALKGTITEIWQPEELQRLFSLANFQKYSGISSAQSNLQSLPLVMTLLMYTGTRLQELCYIESSDFKLKDRQSDGSIPVIVIQPHEGRRVKTLSAIRKIPLHPDLRELGVLDYFVSRQKAGRKYLLDVPTKGGLRSKACTDRFIAYRDKLGFEAGTGKSLRTFRKTLNTKLVGVSQSDDVKRLMGHSLGNVNDSNYTDRLALPQDRIYGALERVNFGLNLSELRDVLTHFIHDYPADK